MRINLYVSATTQGRSGYYSAMLSAYNNDELIKRIEFRDEAPLTSRALLELSAVRVALTTLTKPCDLEITTKHNSPLVDLLTMTNPPTDNQVRDAVKRIHSLALSKSITLSYPNHTTVNSELVGVEQAF